MLILRPGIQTSDTVTISNWWIINEFEKVLILAFITFRWYTWTIHRSFKVIWIWRISPRGKLLVFGWLRGQRKAVFGNHLSFVSVQDQISRELLSVAWKPRVCKHQQNIRLLWWMWVCVFVLCLGLVINHVRASIMNWRRWSE